MKGALIGREAELEALRRFLERACDGAAALVLEGEPGIGKTALWRAGVENAAERGFRVLTSRPSGSEARLSFAGLGDLASGVAEDVLSELPPPQRHALEVALALAEPETSLDQRVLGIALRRVLVLLAGRGPLLIALDDVQWLDKPSASVLEFALRRITEERVGLLVTVRRERGTPVAIDLVRELPEERLERLALAPLSIGGLHELLRARLDLIVSRPQLVRLHDASGGNPFYALELGRELTRVSGELPPGRPLPLPESLHELLRVRLARLPARTRDVLLAAAALAKPTPALLEAAVGDEERVAIALEKAARAGVIELEGSNVRFSHPLLASVLYDEASLHRRRTTHRRLSEMARDPEERARHLALATRGPAAAVAAVLEEAAHHASGRGAPAAAAELAELAAGLTPLEDKEASRQRRAEAAGHHSAAGDFGRARTLLEELLGELPPGGERSDALLRLASARYSDDMGAVVSYCEQALEEARGDDRRMAEIHRSLSGFLWMLGDASGALAHARHAVEAAERAGDRASLAATLARLAMLATYAGDTTPGVLERALELEPTNEYLPGYQSPTTVLGVRLMLSDRLDAARERFEAELGKAAAQGDEWKRCQLVLHLAELEWRAGSWDRAEHYAAEAHELTEQFGLGRGAGLYVKALLDAYRGRVQEARAAAERGVLIAQTAGITPHELQNLGVLGFLELSLGNLEEADRYLRPLPDRLLSVDTNEPTNYPVWPIAIETLVLMGKLDEARSYLEQYEERAERFGSPWALSTAARCRAVLSAAQGDFDTAFASFERALAEHARMPGQFERGRTLLALGATQRRAKKRRAARESLAHALAIFDELGAPLWAEKARLELARVSGRPPASKELTATERRVAGLVAQGRSNKEVAAQLYVSVPTVEGHLSRIYGKLDVRSRTELAHRLTEADAAKV